MTKAELLELISNGENSGVEFKRDNCCVATEDARSLAIELVALSNLRGGRVILGVEDDGSISGVTRSDLEQWVMNVCRDLIRPEIIPYFELIHNVQPGKDVAIVEVETGWAVHHLWSHNHRNYYIRAGTQSREASAEELERLFQQRGAIRVELRPVSGTTAESLDLRRLDEYFTAIRLQAAPGREDREGWRRLLANTEILSDSSNAFPCTVAGLLLFGKNPSRFLPQAGISAVAYRGKEKEYTTMERAAFRGPLVRLGATGAGADTDTLEPGLVEQALHFIERNAGHEAIIVEGRRVERNAFPAEVLREAIVNALVHRDYLLSATDVEISLYSDRLEIVSPGRLPNGITPERMRVGCRAARNQMIKDVMRDYGYLEHMGMGVPRKIVRGMKEHNGSDPGLIADEEQFTVRLWRSS
jgi:ATP-dependent DNA helicase RecG